MSHERVEYIFSHALECPMLLDVTEKIALLQYKTGSMKMLLSDGGNYFEYESLLKGIGIIMKNENVYTFSEHGKPIWEVRISILPMYQGISSVQCRTIDSAFAELKHILLCGLVLKTGTGRYQFISSKDGKLPSIRKL